MKPESRPSSEQGLASAVNLAGAFDHEFTQTPLAKHASFSGSLVAEVSSLCISSVSLIFDNAGLPTTKPRDSALRAVTKVSVLLTPSGRRRRILLNSANERRRRS